MTPVRSRTDSMRSNGRHLARVGVALAGREALLDRESRGGLEAEDHAGKRGAQRVGHLEQRLLWQADVVDDRPRGQVIEHRAVGTDGLARDAQLQRRRRRSSEGASRWRAPAGCLPPRASQAPRSCARRTLPCAGRMVPSMSVPTSLTRLGYVADSAPPGPFGPRQGSSWHPPGENPAVMPRLDEEV